VLTYVTGGLAYGQVDTEATKTTNATVLGFATPKSFFITQAGSSSHVNTGWVVGFGTEGKLFIPGWTLKAEALFMDLGTLDATASGASSGIIPGTLAIWNAAPASTHSHFTDSIFRVGLNYQFH
jgi:outer membrane immunogenic protein